MIDVQRIKALLELGWSYGRIQRETGIRRETIAQYDSRRDPNAATVCARREYFKTGQSVLLSRKNVSLIAKRFCQCAINFPS
jgi:hypothetical protein